MKYWLFGFFLLWSGLLPGQHTRWAVGPEVGTGIGYQTCCGDSRGYHHFGATVEYRLRRWLSAEASMRYSALESSLNGRGYNNIYSFRGFQRTRGTAFTIGPRLNIRLKPALELSGVFRAGIMPGRVSQDITNNDLPFQTRRYRTHVVWAYGGEVRLGWWLDERIAVEWGIGLWDTHDQHQALTLKSETGTPFPPDITSEFPSEFIRQINERVGRTGALTLGMGIRYRL